MSAWANTRVLVTGAGGFIGSHLTERLAGLGARTRALVRYTSSGAWGWLDRSPVKEDVEVLAGDVRDRDSVRQAVAGVDVVFHLAALIGIPYSYHAPESYVRTNIEGTLNVLQAAREAGTRLVVHTSTSEVYGTAQYVPMDEEHPLQAQSPYAASKVGADKMAEAFHRSFGLPVAILRPFNTFGPRQSARAVVPTIITQALTEGRVRLGSLTPTRDLNYVANTVEGYLLAAQTPVAVGCTLNLGSGREVSIGELVQLIAALAGRSVAVEQEPARVRPEASEVERLLADARAAKALLGWQPSVSLEEGLRLTVEWMREHLDAYRPSVYAV
jgi:dTDP-glucose 4,6-dehydratase